MSTKTTPPSPVSHQPGAMPGWLMAHQLKRGALLYWAALFTLSSAILHVTAGVAELPRSGLLVVLLIGFAIIQTAISIAVVMLPSRCLLVAAVVIQGVSLLLWIGVHSIGFMIGAALWRPETLGTTDLYLPAMEEAVSAFFFLCLLGRTWTLTSRSWHITLAWW